MPEQNKNEQPSGGDHPLFVTVYDGKYTVVQEKDGKLYALRNGQPWRDCVGDNLVLALAQEVDQLRAQLAAATQAKEKAELDSKSWSLVAEARLKEIERHIADKEKAEAACAEMRGILGKSRWMDWREYDGGNHFEIANVFRHDMEHALSTDHGKGFLRAEELKPTIELLEFLKTEVLEVEGGYPNTIAMVVGEVSRLQKLREGK